jgi:hypothetical protein
MKNGFTILAFHSSLKGMREISKEREGVKSFVILGEKS